MKKEFKQRRVRYVVGDGLGHPVVVEHLVPVDDEVQDTQAPVSETTALAKRIGSAGNPKHRAKRTCGQSQRSAREARKQRVKK